MFCAYRDVLGKVKQGVHSYRFMNIAIVDVLLTLLGAYLIHQSMPQYSFWLILLFLFIMGIILHRLFCVRTTIDKLLFP
jgi:hypothetical protein